jgi:hypothetical protein
MMVMVLAPVAPVERVDVGGSTSGSGLGLGLSDANADDDDDDDDEACCADADAELPSLPLLTAKRTDDTS